MPSKNLTVSRTSTKIAGPEACGHAPQERAEQVRPQKVGFVSLGCPKNLVNSEVIWDCWRGLGPSFHHEPRMRM